MKKLLFILIFIISQLFSIEFSDIKLGDTLYIDDISSYEEVVVIDINKSRGVKIIGKDDKEAYWWEGKIYTSKEKWKDRAEFASGLLDGLWDIISK